MIMPINSGAPDSRIASKSLGAGALLDIGIYALTWASIVLDSSPKRDPKQQPELSASMLFHADTNEDDRIDEQDTVVLRYNDLKAQAICTASLLRKTGDEFCNISGSKGSIGVGGMAASRPGYLVLRVGGEEEKRIDFEIPGFGFLYEQDAVAEDLRRGRLQSEVCSFETSLMVMRRMDEARKQCGLVYPQDR